MNKFIVRLVKKMASYTSGMSIKIYALKLQPHSHFLKPHEFHSLPVQHMPSDFVSSPSHLTFPAHLLTCSHSS